MLERSSCHSTGYSTTRRSETESGGKDARRLYVYVIYSRQMLGLIRVFVQGYTLNFAACVKCNLK